METITIPMSEYLELKEQAEKFQQISKNNANAGRASAMKLTPQQRRERAIKAVRAREEKRRLRKIEESKG